METITFDKKKFELFMAAIEEQYSKNEKSQQMEVFKAFLKSCEIVPSKTEAPTLVCD